MGFESGAGFFGNFVTGAFYFSPVFSSPLPLAYSRVCSLPFRRPDSAGVLPVALPVNRGSYFPWLNQPRFCELARSARDADIRRLPADAPSAQPAE